MSPLPSATPSPVINDRTTQYARDVLDGKILAGPLVRLACKRHLRDLETGRARGLTFSIGHANRAFSFFENYLCLAEGQFEKQPFRLQPWQCFILGSIFGWLGPDGYRRFRTAYIEIGKGNGKSPMAAGVGLYGLIADGEHAAEIYSAAVTKDQARIVFRDAENMRAASPLLARRIQSHVNNLSVRDSLSYFRAVSSEKRGLDGHRVHMALIDEIHEHPNATVVDKMRAGTKARRQALIFEITNSGYDRTTICWDHHEQSRQILEGALENDSWFAYVANLDPGDDWKRDESCWVKTNPNLGVSVTTKYLREQVAEAVQMPTKENIVARLNFCVWTEQDVRAIVMDDWHACKAEWPPEDLLGKPCFGGLDLSRTTDLTAYVEVFPWEIDGRRLYRLLAEFWMPEDRVAFLENRDRVPYRQWQRQGFIRFTPGNTVDYSFVRETILAHRASYKLLEVGYDPWNSNEAATQLAAQGIKMVEMRQTVAVLSEPTKKFLDYILDRRIQHNGHPILTWHASNLVVTQDSKGNLLPNKGKSVKKIDGMSAAITAFARAILVSEKRSVYDTRGIIRI